MISGVVLTRLQQIFDRRSKIMHMPGIVKAWHLHKAMTLNYAVMYGEIKFVLFYDRPENSARGKI